MSNINDSLDLNKVEENSYPHNLPTPPLINNHNEKVGRPLDDIDVDRNDNDNHVQKKLKLSDQQPAESDIRSPRLDDEQSNPMSDVPQQQPTPKPETIPASQNQSQNENVNNDVNHDVNSNVQVPKVDEPAEIVKSDDAPSVPIDSITIENNETQNQSNFESVAVNLSNDNKDHQQNLNDVNRQQQGSIEPKNESEESKAEPIIETPSVESKQQPQESQSQPQVIQQESQPQVSNHEAQPLEQHKPLEHPEQPIEQQQPQASEQAVGEQPQQPLEHQTQTQSEQQPQPSTEQPQQSSVPGAPKLPPRSKEIGVPEGPPFSSSQLKYISTIIKQLKKNKFASPFLQPVDPIALGVPHYLNVISEPSDLGTVDKRVQKTIKAEEGGYQNYNDWETDVRRIFRNTEWFNGIEHPISKSGKQLEEAFEKQLKKMPSSEEKPTATTSKQKVGAPRKSGESLNGRPKREIHPPMKELPYAIEEMQNPRPKRRKSSAYGRNGTAEQMRYCLSIIKEFNKKVHVNYASPFYEPVDYIGMGIPDYPQIIKQPMDLSTINRKLSTNEYEGPKEFEQDIRLMFKNCYRYNPAGTPVHEAGRKLESLFDEKWSNLPQPQSPKEEVFSDEDDDVRQLQKQIEDMQKSLGEIRKRGAKTGKRGRHSTSGNGGPGSGNVGRPRKSVEEEDEQIIVPEVTFEMKKELASRIQELEGENLNKAIKIIYETLELDNTNDEIELDIDVLPVKTLQKLYMFVVKPQKQKRGPYNKSNNQQPVDIDAQPKPPKRAGTGGVKRKSMNEDEEAAKIQALEAKLKSFDGNGNATTEGLTAQLDQNDEASSGSESESGSESGSESE